MANEVIKGLDEILMNASQIEKEINSKVALYCSKEIDIPSFEEVQKRGNLYKYYGDTVVLNDEVVKVIMRANQVIIALKDIRGSMSVSDGVPMSLAVQYKNRVDKIINKLNDQVSVMKLYKDDLDSVLRYYSSVQYILGSPRLMGME